MGMGCPGVCKLHWNCIAPLHCNHFSVHCSWPEYKCEGSGSGQDSADRIVINGQWWHSPNQGHGDDHDDGGHLEGEDDDVDHFGDLLGYSTGYASVL